jgi:methionine synthase / methylenetetrahydrofolate reductase(NADPH)
MKLQDYFLEKQHDHHAVLLTDGAMGTYYAELTGDTQGFCELANTKNPQVILDIHKAYLSAGARLIRTNTFAANRYALNVTREEQTEILRRGFELAVEAAAGTDAFVAASIGPIRRTGEEEDQEILEEFLFVSKTLVDAGARNFVFETFSDAAYLCTVAESIKAWAPDAFVLTQFAFSSDGLTRDGYGFHSIFDAIEACSAIDAYGLNCGSGPSQLRKLTERVERKGKPISVLPNASFPEVINERTVYVNNPTYFATVMEDVVKQGVQIVGGCCGTTPDHIRALAAVLGRVSLNSEPTHPATPAPKRKRHQKTSHFQEKLSRGDFITAVEMDPPFDIQIDRMVEHARLCGASGVDLVTIADSPRGIARVDSLMTAALIHRETGMEVMPHLCCRDKNINAIRSGLMACHIEGIRNILAVTGDPILEADKVTTKSVFNLNAYRLIDLISVMNREMCPDRNMTIAAALNLNVADLEGEYLRLTKKIQKGAGVFLTQPIFEERAMAALKDVKERFGIKIIAGIMPLVGYKNAVFLNNEVPGIKVPPEVMERFSPDMSREEAQAEGERIAVEIATRIRPDVDGFYMIIPFSRTQMVLDILQTLKNSGVIQSVDEKSGRHAYDRNR